MPLAAGAAVGPYRIRSLLGAGGMGEVYLARDTALDRDVALKLLPSELTSDADRLRRFETEARAASGLNHPAIVAVYELGTVADHRFIAMELVVGQTLRQLVSEGDIPIRRALHLAAQIADGLAKAHDAGIVHRDLKPENLMVSNDGFAKILDFGLAKLTGDAEVAALAATKTGQGTRPGTVMGTVGYMSPEQAAGRTIDYRSDQFSFGVVLYELLTGQQAFDRPTAVETLAAIVRDDPPPMTPRTPIPAPVRWIVDRCLAKSPADRYGSTRDLARDLAAARDHLSELSNASASAPVTAVAPSRRATTRELVAWALAAVFAAGAGVLMWSERRVATPPPRAVRFSFALPDKQDLVSQIGAVPFAVSADGQQIAFVASEGPGARQLWVHAFDSPTSRPVPGTQRALSPFWSPDGRAIAFYADGKLKRVSLAEGEVATICDARPGGPGTWSADGVIVFAPGLDTTLHRVSSNGGTPVEITQLDASRNDAAHILPVFLPDRRHFIYSTIAAKVEVYVGSLDSGERKPMGVDGLAIGVVEPDILLFAKEDRALMAQRFDRGNLTMVGDPVRVAEDLDEQGPAVGAAVSPTGTLVSWSGARVITQPTWVNRAGAAIGTVGPPAAYVNLMLSPDGTQVAVDRFDPNPAVWLLDVVRGTPTRATFGGTYESTPVWSPDGRSLAFASAREGPPNLFLKQLTVSGAEERLVRTPFQSFPLTWSPDGRYLLYVTLEPKTARDIWLLPMTGERTPSPLLRTAFNEGLPRISPDGRWLAYASTESGANAIYVTAFPEPGAKWRVSPESGSFPVWSRDGRELFYVAPGGLLTAVPIRPGPSFDSGTAVPLFKVNALIGGVGGGTFYDVAKDGRFLVNLLVEHRSPPISVVLNLRSTLAALH
jgi:Tol biopolymer transport system component